MDLKVPTDSRLGLFRRHKRTSLAEAPLESDGQVTPIAPWEWLGVGACAFIFFVIRLPLYNYPGVILGWHSDAALLGLMARSLADGDIPWLFWASDYLAPLTSVFAAGVGTLLNDIGPLALRLGVGIEVLAALFFYYAALRRVVDRRAALLSFLWLVAGPAFLYKLTYAPLSAEQYFFLGAVIFWYAIRAPFRKLHQWLILGLLTGLGWWIHRGALFASIPALVTIALYDRHRVARHELTVGTLVFAAGAVLGALPKLLGVYGFDQRLYAPLKPQWRIERAIDRLMETVTHDYWLLVAGDLRPLTWLAGGVFALLLASAARHFSWRRETCMSAGVLAICGVFWIFSTDAYQGAVRYIMISVPVLCAFAAGEIVRLWDRRTTLGAAGAVLCAMLIGASYFFPAYQQTMAVTRAEREVFENWGGFDPRPALQVIRAGGYSVCYADVWVAHKLEWLSNPTVRFIPYRSVNRRMVESLRLAALRSRKCFVDDAGKVRSLTAVEEWRMRRDVLWHMHGWSRPAEWSRQR